MVFTEKNELIRKLARDFAEKELTPEVIAKMEETGETPLDVVKKAGEAGLLGIKVPKEMGGSGEDIVSYVLAMQEISKVNAAFSLYLSATNSLAGGPLMMCGNAEQIERCLVPAIKGDHLLCFGLTEPGAGSDAGGGMATTAVEDGDYYVLNGRKTMISGSIYAKYGIIYAKTDVSKGAKGITAFIVDMDLEGVTRDKTQAKMGLLGCPMGDIILENVRVHKSDVLGQIDKGFISAMTALDTGRLTVATQSIGVAEAALEETIKHVKERKQFGQSLAQFQNVSFTIAEMATKLKAAKELVYEVAKARDLGTAGSADAAMAKLFASNVCNEICAKGVQLHGGYGLMKDYKIERLYRDCRVFTIFEGADEVLKMVIAGTVLA